MTLALRRTVFLDGDNHILPCLMTRASQRDCQTSSICTATN
jgi:hypothetical protein